MEIIKSEVTAEQRAGWEADKARQGGGITKKNPQLSAAPHAVRQGQAPARETASLEMEQRPPQGELSKAEACFTRSQGSSGSLTTATSSPTAEERLPETVSLHTGRPVICTSSCDTPAERAGTGRQRSSVPRLCPKKTAHSYFYNIFF